MLKFPVQVAPTATVSFDGRIYSMPPQAIGVPATLYLGRFTVRIVAGRVHAQHPRLEASGARSTLPEHRVAMIAAVNGRRGRLYLMRQHLLELDPVMLDYLTELVHRRGHGGWTRDIELMHALLEMHGPTEIVRAVRRAHAIGFYSGRAVAKELDIDDTTLLSAHYGETH
jgi:hypothetical protein